MVIYNLLSSLSNLSCSNHLQAVTVADILVDPTTSTIYHIESRPSEKGRNVVVNTATGQDVTSGKEWNFRTGVHEYGGASAIAHGGIVYFSDYGSDGNGRVYRVKEGDEPEAVTPGKNLNLLIKNEDLVPTFCNVLQRARLIGLLPSPYILYTHISLSPFWKTTPLMNQLR